MKQGLKYGLLAASAIFGLHGVSTADTPETGADLISIYKHLHANPELSLKEANTSALLSAELEALGFDVTTRLGDDWVREKAETDQGMVRDGVGGYGVVGVMENGEGPTLLIRADMDALPVHERTGFDFSSEVTDITWTGVDSSVMHACGHDIHMTSWLGTARELVARKDEWSGTLVMILQPAEELGLGATAMISDGLFDRFPLPDYNLALHVNANMPAGQIGYVSGFSMANVDSVDISVKGVGGHGAYPHTTIDPVVIASNIVMAVQTLVARNINPQNPAVVTVGSITGGTKHNIIPDEVHLKLTVRSYRDDVRDQLLSGIERIALGMAETYGAPEPTLKIDADYTPANFNDPELSEVIANAMKNELGDPNVVELSPVMGGEDFSQYGRTVEDIPGVLFWIGAVDPETYEKSLGASLPLPSLHSSFFAPDYEKTIETGVSAMTSSAMAVLKK
ncbi:MAG: peptidase M20 [Ponticaulis sp.]|nr:peptidase M20 [Ponticaulis sp.]|tara:strand:- start:1088 stop:2446 length:1359 start_codon:yes stop_codon:yes gene_type:complete